jgi:hypothetical protein
VTVRQEPKGAVSIALAALFRVPSMFGKLEVQVLYTT